MSEEEIHKALEIIKQPITINCKEYHYFDQENYDKLVAVYDNCLWFIRNFEQINTTVERVQKEKQQLKEVIGEVRELRDQFIDENELSVWENDSLINFVNKLLQILDKGVKNE